MGIQVKELLKAYKQYDEEQEQALLDRILAAGWDQGCWLRAAPDRLATLDPAETSALFAELEKRAGGPYGSGSDPYPDGRPHEAIRGKKSCLVVTSQRCDLLAPFRHEPFVELARAEWVDDAERIRQAWRRSYREYPVDPTSPAGFMVDLRTRYYLPKFELDREPKLEPRQALLIDTDDLPMRRRFADRLGYRSSRLAVPTEYATTVRKELERIVKNDPEADELFHDILIDPAGTSLPRLVFTVRVSADASEKDAADRVDRADRRLFEVLDALPKKCLQLLAPLDDEPHQVIPLDQLTVAVWRRSWKVDVDHLTWGGDGGGAAPTR